MASRLIKMVFSVATWVRAKRRVAPRPAFTLIELLVVVAIIGMLVALLMPAVNAAREAGRRARCAVNIRQITLGALSFCEATGTYPAGGVQAKPVPTANSNGWNRMIPDDWSNNFTWPTLILPYIDQVDAYRMYQFAQSQTSSANALARSQPVTTYVCPDDRLQINEPQPGEDGYGQGPTGTSPPPGPGPWAWNYSTYSRMRLNYAANYGNTGYNQLALGGVTFLGGMFTNGYGYTTASIKDGASNTLAFSEVLPGHGPWYAGPPGDGMVAEGGQAFEGYVTPNSGAPDVVANICPPSRALQVPCVATMTDALQYQAAQSAHPGGVNASFGDGAVKYFSNSVNWSIWQALCSSNGGEGVTVAMY